MDQGEVFLKAWGLLGRIKTVYVQKFTRPVAEETRRVENPATHVGKPLPFNQIMLVTLQGFLGALPIFDVGCNAAFPSLYIYIKSAHSASRGGYVPAATALLRSMPWSKEGSQTNASAQCKEP